jgi:hypothetical protein
MEKAATRAVEIRVSRLSAVAPLVSPCEADADDPGDLLLQLLPGVREVEVYFEDLLGQVQRQIPGTGQQHARQGRRGLQDARFVLFSLGTFRWLLLLCRHAQSLFSGA